MVVVKRVTTRDEVLGIKSLQTANLRSTVGDEEAGREGFVTAQYTLEFLEEMNRAEPSVIARDGDTVVGYAMVTTREIAARHDLMRDLCDHINQHAFHGNRLAEHNYILVGQLCVAKSHRGLGLVQQMYDFYRRELSSRYAYCLTDVDERNPRSIKAHLKAGFQVLGSLRFGGNQWQIVIWDWNDSPWRKS